MNKPLSTKSFLRPHPEEPWVLPLACPGFCCPSRYQEAQVAATPGNLLTPWPLDVTLLCSPPMSLVTPSLCPFLTPSSPKCKPCALYATLAFTLLHLGNTSYLWLHDHLYSMTLNLYSSLGFSSTLQFRCPQASPTGHVVITNYSPSTA